MVTGDKSLLSAPRRLSVALLAVIAFSVAIRVLLIHEAQPHLVSDARDYYVLAKNLYDGEGYIQEYHGESPEYRGLTFRAYRMPGYPVVLASLFSFVGPSPYAAFWLNVVCELLTILIVFAVARSLMGRGAGVCASLLMAALPLWTVSVLTESVFTLLFTAVVASVLVLSSPVPWWRSLLLGGITAAAVFTRPIAVVLYLPLLIAGWRGARPFLHSAIILMPLIVLLAGWVSRNERVLGHPVFFSTNFGAHNAGDIGVDRRLVIEELKAKGSVNELLINQTLTEKFVHRVTQEPDVMLTLFLSRSLKMFSLAPPHEIKAIAWEITLPPGSDGSTLHRASYSLLGPVYFFAAVGALLSLVFRHRLMLCAGVVIVFVLLHGVISNGSFRFFSPLLPLLALLAVYPFWELLHRWKRHS